MDLDIEYLLPHRPPMRWIDQLTECSQTTARATATFSADHFAVVQNVVLESALIECLAQTISAAQGYRARRQGGYGGPSGGMLAGVANFKIHSPPRPHQRLEFEVSEIKRFGPMLLVAGQVWSDGRSIATGELTVYA